jgi:hypothetical protein
MCLDTRSAPEDRRSGADQACDVVVCRWRSALRAWLAARRGPRWKSRILTKAADHDFEAQDTVTPVGIFLPASDELFLYGVTSKVTSDCLVDRLIQWWESVKERFAQIKTLVIHLDNGPENQSHRTQFMQRLLDFTQTY